MLLSIFLAAANAQVAFDTAIDSPSGPEGVAILKDGSELKGKPLVVPKGRGNLKMVTIKMEDKTKHKLGPDDIQSFMLKPNKLTKMANTKTSITAMASGANQSNYREYIHYIPANLPNGKPAIMQHLNRGFDDTIKIFADPKGRETAGVGVGGVQISGGLDKAYLVLKKGAPNTFIVKKGSYDKQWEEIFGDCPAMQKPEKADFKDFPGHVKMHMDKCGTAPAKTEAAVKPPPKDAPPVEAMPMENGTDDQTTNETKSED